jgi:aldose 1-epimerase
VTGVSGGFAPPSGEQFELRSGGHHAVVTEVGATLRSYRVDGADVIDGFAIDERSSAGRGEVLAPWPNRLGDGHYEFEGQQGQAPLDEPARSNAIHGLVRWLPWNAVSRTSDAVTMACVLHPQPAYPWRLSLQVEYRLGQDGLTVVSEATNLTDHTAPFGLGFHPYLTPGTPTVDTATLVLPARRRLLVDDRALPTGDAELAGTEFDFAAERPVGSLVLDTAYTDLVRDEDGRARARLRGADGRAVTVWVDDTFRHLMVFTGDTLEPERRRRSIAIEPMTCPPDALRSGTDLIRLEPGASWSGTWGVVVD